MDQVASKVTPTKHLKNYKFDGVESELSSDKDPSTAAHRNMGYIAKEAWILQEISFGWSHVMDRIPMYALTKGWRLILGKKTLMFPPFLYTTSVL
jgi:hypothetical protein